MRQNSELIILFNIIHEDCNKLVIVTIIKIIVINGKKAFTSVFQFCLHGLSPGDCTMAIQQLEDNHQYFTHKKNTFFIKSNCILKI